MPPLKVKIATRMLLNKRWLDEIKKNLPDIEFEVVYTPLLQMRVYYDPRQQSNYGDFNSVREIVNSTTVNARVFVMSYADLRGLGITNHLAVYDNSDRDGIFDFYIGVPDAFDSRARDNRYSSNFAWLFEHEISHGFEQNLGHEYLSANGDRTHAMEAQERLKELLVGDAVTLPKLQVIVNGLKAALALLLNTTPMTHPLALPYRNQITQQYGVENPIYRLTQRHIGTDYSCPVGTPLVAPAPGQIVFAGKSPERGNYIQFKHGKYLLELRHLSMMMPVGTYPQGAVIAQSGNSGTLTDGPHVCMVVWLGQDGLPIINKTNWSQLTVAADKVYTA